MNNKIIVFYHKDCLDGFSCAWISFLYFKNKVNYFSIEPGQNISNRLTNKDIYFFDVCPNEKDLINLSKNNNKITIIDHHVTNKFLIKKIANNYIFNINHSASFLTWKFFFKKEKIPRLLYYIEAIDLWKQKTKNFDKILSFLEIQKQEFNHWLKLKNIFENRKMFKKILKIGEIVLNIKNNLILQIIKNKQLIEFEKFKIYAVNSSIFNSEISRFLINKNKKFCIIWYQAKDKIKVSLRSVKNFNVAKLAKKYKGGGHKNAAGFYFKINKKIPWKIIK